MNYQLKETDYFTLWKYFSDEAIQIKDKLWTNASFLFTLMGGLLGYIVKGLDIKACQFERPELAGFIALMGIVLIWYSCEMINSYGRHIRTAWNRTDHLRSVIEGMNEVWKRGYADYTGEDQEQICKHENPT